MALIYLELVCFSVPDGSQVTFQGVTYTAKDSPSGAHEFQATAPGVVYGGGVETEIEPGVYEFTHNSGQLAVWNALQASLQDLCDKMDADPSTNGYYFIRGQTEKPPQPGFEGNPNDGALFQISGLNDGVLLGAVDYSSNFTFYDTNEPQDWTFEFYNITAGPYVAGQQYDIYVRYFLNGVENNNPPIDAFEWYKNDVLIVPSSSITAIADHLSGDLMPSAGSYTFKLVVHFLDGTDPQLSQAATVPAPDADPVYGCMDPTASNYNPLATVDDGTCAYPPTTPQLVCPIPVVATLTYLPLEFVRNPVEFKAFSNAVGDRGGRRYFADLLLPAFPGSSDFVKLLTLEAHEKPPYLVNGVEYLDYAYFDLHVCLETQLKAKLPAFRQTDMQPVQTHTMPYQIDWSVTPTDESGSQAAKWVFLGGLSWEDFPAWKDTFFTEHLAASKRFLTWAPVRKTVDRFQQDYLYFLVNFTPLPTSLKLKVRMIFTDGQCMIVTKPTRDSVSQYEVYVMPTGFTELDLEQYETEELIIASYDVWLENQASERLSEIRTYVLANEYRRNLVELMLANSLGGFDCIGLTGSYELGLETSFDNVEVTQGRSYQVTEPARFKTNLEGQRTLTANTGWILPDEFDYVQEILLSKQIYLVNDRALVPLTLTSKKVVYSKLDDRLRGLKLEFDRGYGERNFSRLPAYVAPTWTVTSTECQTDENGNNTTYLEYHETNQYGGTRIRISENPVPGTCPYNEETTVGFTKTDPIPNKLNVFKDNGDGSASQYSNGAHQVLRTDVIFVCILYADQPQTVEIAAVGPSGREVLFSGEITAQADPITGLEPGAGVSYTINFDPDYSAYEINRL